MEKEIIALKKNNTWQLVPLTTEKRIVGCRWVFSVKQKPNGAMERYKARLVAKNSRELMT